MKKLVPFLIILILLLVGVYFFVFNDKTDNYPSFSYDFEKLDKIFIVNENGNSITLNKTENNWLVNNKFSPNIELLNNLKQAIAEQKVIFPIENNKKKIVSDLFKLHNTKVELYKNNKLVKTFYIGKPDDESRGNYMCENLNSGIYMVGIPTEPKVLQYAYNTNLEQWKSIYIINEKPDDIKNIKLTYTDSSNSSFEIINNNPLYEIHDKNNVKVEANQNKLKSYFDFFQKVSCLGHENNYTYKDSLMKKENKYADIELTMKDNKKLFFEFYFVPQNRRSKNLHGEVDPNKKDDDYFFAYLKNENDFVMVTRKAFEKIFQGLNNFK